MEELELLRSEELAALEAERAWVEQRELLDLRQKASRLRGSKKLQMILDVPSPGALVQSMPVQELLHTVKDIGLADSAEIVQLATKEQVRGCLDLDCWKKDKFDREQFFQWLQFLPAKEVEAAEQVLSSVESELLVLYFQGMFRIHENEPDDRTTPKEPKPPIEGELVEMPDRFYSVEIPFEPEDPRSVVAHTALDLFRQYGYEFCHKFFEAIRWSLSSELEELSYEFRRRRIRDIGFVDYFDAIGIYQPLPKHAQPLPPSVPDEETRLVPTLASPLQQQGAFARAIAAIEDPFVLERVQAEFLFLTNKVISADQVDPSSPQATRKIVRSIQRTLDVGLEFLCQGGAAAVEIVMHSHLEWLFRNGFTLLAQLRQQVNRLFKDERFFWLKEVGGSLLREEHHESLLALKTRKPRFPTQWEEPPGSIARPFRHLGDVQRCQQMLGMLRFLPTLFFERLPFHFDTLREQVEVEFLADSAFEPIDFEKLFLTALVHFALHQRFEARPLTTEEVESFYERAFVFGDNAMPPHPIDPVLKERVEEALVSLPDTTEEEATWTRMFLAGVWGRLFEEAAFLPRGEKLDPRFVKLFWMAKTPALQA